MRLLKFCTSDDFPADIPEDQRNWRIAERVFTAATGEPAETILKKVWPTPDLPDRLERWVAESRPDMVLFMVSPYWMTAESVGLKLQRRYGRAGAWANRLGDRALKTPHIRDNGLFQALHRAAIDRIGGEVQVSPEEVVRVTEACIRRVVRHEDLAVIVRTPLRSIAVRAGAAGRARAEERRQRVHRPLKALCEQYHLTYIGFDTIPDDENYTGIKPDGVHSGPGQHARQGRIEGEAMVRAWQRVAAARPR